MSESVLIPAKYGVKLTCAKPIHGPKPYEWTYTGNRPYASCPICRSQIVVSPKRRVNSSSKTSSTTTNQNNGGNKIRGDSA
jgi:hypothetical protein